MKRFGIPYMEEVALKKEGTLPSWKAGTAIAVFFLKEEERESYGDHKAFEASHKKAIQGTWNEIKHVPSTIKIPKGTVYQFSTLRDGSSPLVVREGEYSIDKKKSGWRITRI